MKAYQRSLLIVTVLAAASAACVGRVRQPEVELAGVRVGGIGLRGATLIAELNIKNPNDFDIETDSVTYEFEVAQTGSGNWSRFTQGSYTQRVKIEEDDNTEVEIPIDFDYSGFSGALRSILDRGTFDYRVRGRVFVREPLERQIPFTKGGNLSLAGAR